MVYERGNEDDLELAEELLHGLKNYQCAESGGPELGMGCAGRRVTMVIKILKKNSAYGDDRDSVSSDALEDVPCSGLICNGRKTDEEFELSAEVP